MTSRRHYDVGNAVVTQLRTMENAEFLFNKVMTPREIDETWNQLLQLTKRPIASNYLPLQYLPIKVVKGYMHNRSWTSPTVSISIALAAVNWWRYYGKMGEVTEESLNTIIAQGKGLDYYARSKATEEALTQEPCLKIVLREHPWIWLCTNGTACSIKNWRQQVKLGSGHDGAGDEQTLAGFLRRFSQGPFGTTVTVGTRSFAILFNIKKEWIIVDSHGKITYSGYHVEAASAWHFSRPEGVEAFLREISPSSNSICTVASPMTPYKEEENKFKVKVDLCLTFDESKLEILPIGVESGRIGVESRPNGSSTKIWEEEEEEDPYVCMMGGFGGY